MFNGVRFLVVVLFEGALVAVPLLSCGSSFSTTFLSGEGLPVPTPTSLPWGCHLTLLVFPWRQAELSCLVWSDVLSWPFCLSFWCGVQRKPRPGSIQELSSTCRGDPRFHGLHLGL